MSPRTDADARLTGLIRDRDTSWLPHWKELAEYILPRRYRWVQPNQGNRGSPINGRIIDSTGTIAARTLAAGMMSGITSPTRPWFKLSIEGYANDESHPVSLWLAECQRRMFRVLQESNFYNAAGVVFGDIGTFGTSCCLIYEDVENVINCVNPAMGEFALGLDDKLQVDTIAREFTLNIKQMDQWFGDANSTTIKELVRAGGPQLQQERVIRHLVEPNKPAMSGLNRGFEYRELYWERGGQDADSFLLQQGLYEFPGFTPRWDVTGNDAYGRSPGMDALGDIKQLQQETKRKAQAIDKMVSPPMVGDIELKNSQATLLPGGITYIARKDGVGFKPAYTVTPQIGELKEDIAEIQNRIKQIFFNDLFMMFQQMEAEPRSAAAVDARREEKLVMLGPVLERFQFEGLDRAIDRVFNIMVRKGLMPDPPAELQSGRPIEVSYVSILAEAQRVAASAGVERLFGFAGNLMAVAPTIMDNLDPDEAIAEYANFMSVSPKLVKSKDEVLTLRAQREKQQQAAQALQMTTAAAQGAKTLSETDVGGGQNALSAMLGTGA